jgi:hypothetical protein
LASSGSSLIKKSGFSEEESKVILLEEISQDLEIFFDVYSEHFVNENILIQKTELKNEQIGENIS